MVDKAKAEERLRMFSEWKEEEEASPNPDPMKLRALNVLLDSLCKEISDADS